MSNYPRREQPTGPPKPKVQSSGPSAYDDNADEQRKPTVRVPVCTGRPGKLGIGEEVEQVEVEADAAQDWDERLWRR